MWQRGQPAHQTVALHFPDRALHRISPPNTMLTPVILVNYRAPRWHWRWAAAAATAAVATTTTIVAGGGGEGGGGGGAHISIDTASSASMECLGMFHRRRNVLKTYCRDWHTSQPPCDRFNYFNSIQQPHQLHHHSSPSLYLIFILCLWDAIRTQSILNLRSHVIWIVRKTRCKVQVWSIKDIGGSSGEE